MPKRKPQARPTHSDYLYFLPYIALTLPSPDSRHVQTAVDHLKGWRVCPVCKEEVRSRQFPQGELAIMHFRSEQLSHPERARRATPLDILGQYIEAKQRRE